MGIAQGTGVLITHAEYQQLLKIIAKGERTFETIADRATGSQTQRSLGLSNKKQIRAFIKYLAGRYGLDMNYRYAVNQHQELVRVLEDERPSSASF